VALFTGVPIRLDSDNLQCRQCKQAFPVVHLQRKPGATIPTKTILDLKLAFGQNF
jgi:hypothetical protein